ncbi:primosomal protein N' [Nitratifractor sp.]
MGYYTVAILRSAGPLLTYRSETPLSIGDLVRVSVRGKEKEAVVIARESDAPDFETAEILERLPRRFAPWQIESARFVAEYYFASIGEALGLFHPLAETPPPRRDLTIEALPTLTPAQEEAYRQMCAHERALLFGVTGSGKTELFIHQMAETLREGKTAILLMPEIALTPQMEKRLRRHFGDAVAIWHSRLNKTKKREVLDRIEAGEIRIVAGARSALFVPLHDLGLIVVDEEHDDSYKAMTRPRYHARDLALYLGAKRGARVWLASATPSTSSYAKFPVVRLREPYTPTRKRYRFVPGETITPTIVRAVEENRERGGQSLLFVPTRANFKYLRCDACGRTRQCPYCSVGMSLHRRRSYLRCHYCGFTEPISDTCEHCGHSPLISDRIGTEEAIEILTEAIPGIRIVQFDKDAITTPRKLEAALDRIERREADAIIGTQMLSKGHDYPGITLSVITGLDYLLGVADYRSRERAMALLHQIAGRSGRNRDALILIQSAMEEYFAPYLEDYEDFLQEELRFLEAGRYPPFAHLARILVAHRDRTRAEAKTTEIVGRLRPFEGIEIVGHGPAPIERLGGKYRYTVLLRSTRRTPLLQALHAVDERGIEIDMDPVEFS